MSKEYWNLSGDIENVYNSIVRNELFPEPNVFLFLQSLDYPAVEIVISSFAFFISVIVWWQTRKHNMNSVMPILNITTSEISLKNKSRQFLLILENNGVGPALIRDVTLEINDNLLYKNSKKENLGTKTSAQMESNIMHHLRKVMGEDGSLLQPRSKRIGITLAFEKLSPDIALRPGDKRVLLDITFDEISDDVFYKATNSINFVVNSESVYRKKQKPVSCKD